MIRPSETQKFWEMVEESLQDVPVYAASQDNDLRGLFEIQLLGDTDAVKPHRADLLAECDTAQLYEEIRRGYGLSLAGMAAAIELCKIRVKEESRAKMEWKE